MDRQYPSRKQGGEDARQDAEAVIASRREQIAVKRSFGELCRKILSVLAIAALLAGTAFRIGVVSGEGMYPRLRDGDLVICYRLENKRNIGDVVVYRAGEKILYGRIVAMGGDTVDMNEDGQLLVNGSVQQEEIFFPTLKEGRTAELPVVLNEDEVFVLGDNREYAEDSRDFGPIAGAQIEGKVISLLRSRGL